MAESILSGDAGRGRLPRAIRGFRDCAGMALANLLQDKSRLAVAIAGTAVPILLLLLQMALLHGVRTQVTRLYDDFSFDVALLPSTYEFMFSSGAFDRLRLAQAGAVPGVAAIFSLNVQGGSWTAADGRRSPIILIGMDDDADFIADPELRAGLSRLGRADAVLMDRFSSRNLGALAPDTAGRLNDRSARIAGQFALGMFFYADGAVAVRNANLPRFASGNGRNVSFGLLRLARGADPQATVRQLAELLPADVRVLTRDELIDGERAFFLSTKPLGIMVTSGMLVAFLAGAVVLWQVLSAEILRRLHEFSTLSAMGFSRLLVLGVGFCETLFLGLAAFLPALLCGAVILQVLESMTHLPAAMTPMLLAEIFAVVMIMCALCAISVLRRIAGARTTSLF
jgi:putative ABC transport system permease protein